MNADNNLLEIGQSRIGLLIDGLKETPRVSVKLERDSQGVELTVPFINGHDDAYWYWFSSGIMFADDPDRTKRRYEPPNSVSFYDAAGKVGLVGSHVTGRKNLIGGTGVGEGRLRFDFTILGAMSGAAYERVNGLRSDVEGLGTWIGLRSLRAKQILEDARVVAVDLHLKSPPNIRIARRLNSEFRANWQYGPGSAPDETVIRERLQIHTEVKRAQSWDEHLQVHLSIRDLLRLSSWRKLNFTSHEVMNVADGIRTLDAKKHGNVWLPVLTTRTGIQTDVVPKLRASDFLFDFADVRSAGVGRWLVLDQKFKRGISNIVGVLELSGASIEAHLAQIGIGFEMLGHDLLIESGLSKNQISKKKYADLVAAVSEPVSGLLPFSESNFIEALRRAYIGTKHADKAPPTLEESSLAYLQAIQVFRAWVATRLGMPQSRLRAALARDWRTHRIQRLLDAPESLSG